MTGSNSVQEQPRNLLTFRPYERTDRERCIGLVIDAWPKMTSNVPGGAGAVFWGLLVDMAYEYSDYHEVACCDGQVVGFAFGRTTGKPSLMELAFYVWLYASAALGIAAKSGMAKAIPLIYRSLVTELRILMKSPDSDGELAFLVVDTQHRRTGIGNKLLSRFIEDAQSKGVQTLSVYTTDPGCNWRFYRAHGFNKAVEFDDDIGTYLEGSRSRGLIFTLDLCRNR